MTFPIRTLPLILSAVLAACGGGSDDNAAPLPAQNPTPLVLSAATTCELPDFRQAVLDRVNQARATSRMCGNASFPAVPALAWNDLLFAAAAGHAQDMAQQDYFSHTSQDGRSFSERISATGYRWSAVAENIAAGQRTVEVVMNGWLQSPGHCANIMGANYTEIAVACVRNDGTDYGRFWAMELGRPR